MTGDWQPGPRPAYHNPAYPLPDPARDGREAEILENQCREALVVEAWNRGGGAVVNSSKSLSRFKWVTWLCSLVMRLIGLK